MKEFVSARGARRMTYRTYKVIVGGRIDGSGIFGLRGRIEVVVNLNGSWVGENPVYEILLVSFGRSGSGSLCKDILEVSDFE